MLQEPWLDHLGNLRGSQYWRIIYPANFYVEGCSRIRSILLINTNISTDSYTVLPIMNSDVTVVRFHGDHGYLSILNIYNEITNNNTISALDSFLDCNMQLVRPSGADHVLWLGNFNRHHLLWEEEMNHHLYESEDYISPLIDLLYKHDMVLALPKGIPIGSSAVAVHRKLDQARQSLVHSHSRRPDYPMRCATLNPTSIS